MSGTEIIAWLTGEVFDLSFSEAVRSVLNRRLETARAILQDQLSRAQINLAEAADRDEAAAMVFDYAEAARQGTARRNLRMLAQILAGKLATPPIHASEFLRWSQILADLSREELLVLARYHRAFQHVVVRQSPERAFPEVYEDLRAAGLVGNEDELDSILHALGRTGLIISKPSFDRTLYVTSWRLNQLMRVIKMEEVFAEPER